MTINSDPDIELSVRHQVHFVTLLELALAAKIKLKKRKKRYETHQSYSTVLFKSLSSTSSSPYNNSLIHVLYHPLLDIATRWL